MYIKVKVSANNKKEVVEKTSEDSFNIAVKEKAEKNKANGRVLEIISEELNVPQNRIRIITGHHMPKKILFISS